MQVVGMKFLRSTEAKQEAVELEIKFLLKESYYRFC
jgi:hypothetical protein